MTVLIIALIPLMAALILGLLWDWKLTVFAISFTAAIASWVLLLVYGLYDAGLIMQCGGDTFWTADDC